MATKILEAGTPAPPFDLPSGPGARTTLASQRGRIVVLAFYPADWNPVCAEQLGIYNELLPVFDGLGATVLGISVDGLWSHLAWAADQHLTIPLLSDFEPKGAISRAYGAYDAAKGVSERALFVIDADGAIRWSYLSPPDVNPGADGVLAAVEALAGRTIEEPVLADLTVPLSPVDHALGPRDAPLQLVEYADYESPACAEAWPGVRTVIRQLGKRLRFAHRHFPVSGVHPRAAIAAEAAEAAAEQGRFWEMHDLLVRNPGALEFQDLYEYAEGLGLDLRRFEADVLTHRFARRVRADFVSGVRSGVNGTPTFFVNGLRHDGGWDAESLLGALLGPPRRAVEAEPGALHG